MGMTSQREALTARIRSMIPGGRAVREVSMFGGIAFMVDGRMLVSAGRDGSLLVRIDPSDSEELLQRAGARISFMGIDRPMGPGWVAVDPGALSADADLKQWVDVALEFHSR